MNSSNKCRYLLLMRHGEVERKQDKFEKDHSLSEKGKKDVEQIVRMTYEYLQSLPGDKQINVAKIWYSDYRHSNETAGFFYQTFNYPELLFESLSELEPNTFFKENKQEMLQKLSKKIITFLSALKGDENSNALLIIGHEPVLGFIAQNILGYKKGSKVLLDRSEIGCIQLIFSRDNKVSTGRRLMWTIAPGDPESMNAIRDKIKSKMDTAKTLGSVIIFLLTFSLGALIDKGKVSYLIDGLGGNGEKRKLVHLFINPFNKYFSDYPSFFFYVFISAIASLFISLILYLAALNAYDLLLMPPRFWSNNSKGKTPDWLVERPPSSATRILFLNMMRVWGGMFIPATWAMIAGLLGIAFVVFRFNPLDYLLIVMIGIGIYKLYKYKAGPKLGAED